MLLLAKHNEVSNVQSFDHRLGSEAQIDLELDRFRKRFFICVHENALVVDNTAAEKSLQDYVASVNRKVNFGDTVLHDYNFLDRVIDQLEGSFLDLRSLHLVDDVVENSVCVLEMSEKR